MGSQLKSAYADVSAVVSWQAALPRRATDFSATALWVGDYEYSVVMLWARWVCGGYALGYRRGPIEKAADCRMGRPDGYPIERLDAGVPATPRRDVSSQP